MNALVLEAEGEEEENQVEEPKTTQNEPQKKKREIYLDSNFHKL